MNKRNKEKARKRAWTLWSKTEAKQFIERPSVKGIFYYDDWYGFYGYKTYQYFLRYERRGREARKIWQN